MRRLALLAAVLPMAATMPQSTPLLVRNGPPWSPAEMTTAPGAFTRMRRYVPVPERPAVIRHRSARNLQTFFGLSALTYREDPACPLWAHRSARSNDGEF